MIGLGTIGTMVSGGFVAQIGYRADLPFHGTDLSHGFRDRYAKSRIAIEHSNADLVFHDLPLEVSRHQGLAEQFDTMHLRFNAGSAVISNPPFPDGTPEIA